MSLKKYRHLLKALSEGDKTTSLCIIKGGGKPLLHCLSECAHNILLGNVPLGVSQKQKLKKYKKELQLIRKKSTKAKDKKKALQKGGFLPALLAPILTSVVAPLVSKLLR